MDLTVVGALIGPIAGAFLGSAAVAAAVSGFVTWRVSKATIALQAGTLNQQRLTENLTLMTELMTLAHGRDPKGLREYLGHGEVVAAIESVATLGVSYDPLRPAADAFLRTMVKQYDPEVDPTTLTEAAIRTDAWGAAKSALTRLRGV